MRGTQSKGRPAASASSPCPRSESGGKARSALYLWGSDWHR